MLAYTYGSARRNTPPGTLLTCVLSPDGVRPAAEREGGGGREAKFYHVEATGKSVRASHQVCMLSHTEQHFHLKMPSGYHGIIPFYVGGPYSSK